MTTETVLRDEAVNSIRVIRRVYSVVSQLPSSSGARGWGQPPFPCFTELLDEFVMHTLQERTNFSKQQILDELLELEGMDVIDVEKGFRTSEIGINVEFEFYSTLLSLQCTFVHKGEVMNAPIQEVW